MPELPEVETVRLQLLNKIVGKTIKSIETRHPKTIGYDANFSQKLTGKQLSNIERIGKLLIFSFTDEDDLFLLAHLKMTGQFFFVDAQGDLYGGGHSVLATDLDLPSPHTRVIFNFTDATTLYFNDMRLFGYTRVATRTEMETAQQKFGPEPIADDFDCTWFSKKIRGRKTSVKAALLDQSFVAGLGNIYVDEALWRAKVRPSRRADRLSTTEAMDLCTAAGDVMRESIAVGGTTFQHFKDTGGKSGNFTNHLQVFGQHGKVCSRCGSTIKKIKVAGRGTHYCPGCQK